MTGWLPTLVAVALALAVGGSARADVCVVINPVLDIGCRDGQGAPSGGEPTPSSEPAGAPREPRESREPEPMVRSSTAVRYDPRRVAVTFKPGVTRARIAAVISNAGGTLVTAIPEIHAYLVGVEPEQRTEVLSSLQSSRAVASASKEPMAEAFDTSPDDTDWPQQDGLRVAGFPRAWDVTQGSSKIVVAVVDTGVDAKHPDLRGALVPGWDFIGNDADPSDDYGHGTAVAGVIAARSNNHAGGAGICWRCLVMPIKVLDSKGNGDDTLIAAGIVWAVDHGARVINLSLGGPGSSVELENALAYANAKGVVLVAAAGNAGVTTQFYPAADPHAVSVAATTVTDRRYSWSNFGSWVRVAAPGCNVAPILGNGYGTFCGTSSATSVVAGLVALELSAQPAATATEAEDALVRAAVPLPAFVQYGRIDAGKTLALLRPAAAKSAVFRGVVGPKVRARSYSLDLGAGPFTAVLRFTGGKRLTLSTPFGRVAGRSPLQLNGTSTAGMFSLRVSGTGAKTSFALAVTYAA
jgi:subtilisin family serine protease